MKKIVVHKRQNNIHPGSLRVTAFIIAVRFLGLRTTRKT